MDNYFQFVNCQWRAHNFNLWTATSSCSTFYHWSHVLSLVQQFFTGKFFSEGAGEMSKHQIRKSYSFFCIYQINQFTIVNSYFFLRMIKINIYLIIILSSFREVHTSYTLWRLLYFGGIFHNEDFLLNIKWYRKQKFEENFRFVCLLLWHFTITFWEILTYLCESEFCCCLQKTIHSQGASV